VRRSADGHPPAAVPTHEEVGVMLQIRDSAETALRRIRSENEVAHDAAVRIGPIETLDGLIGIGFAFTDGPEDGDQTVYECTWPPSWPSR
jgi:hypothetical protein